MTFRTNYVRSMNAVLAVFQIEQNAEIYVVARMQRIWRRAGEHGPARRHLSTPAVLWR